MPLVKNIKESSALGGKPAHSSAFLEAWKNKTGDAPMSCSVQGCYGTDLVGAQVQKVNDFDEDSYIAPICKACCQKDDELYVSAELVPTRDI